MLAGLVIPVGRLAQASNAPVRPSSNRSTYKTHPVRPSSNRSAYKTRPIRPSRTPQSQTDLSDQLALTQVTKDFPTNHIKQVNALLLQKIQLNLIPQYASNVCNVKDDMNARHYNSNDCNYTSLCRFRQTSSTKWKRVPLLQEGSFIHTRSQWPHFPAKYSSICCS
ncbi:hypothetical protein Pint_30380 [Pistacia integerrima]|uniref:Uncharacterized protein n=1 Tax=Pistacia integerrima TaxID=434235 RepID=A0ACC0X297_9ROSI|nr:hypothetical protein Pint_30380 [Pistacia integerrima]